MIDYSKLGDKDRKNEFAVLDEFKDLTVEELRAIQDQQTFPFAICLLNVTGELNVGSAIRSACAMGAKEVVIFGRRWIDNRSTVNSLNYIRVSRIFGLKEDGVSIDPKPFWEMVDDNNYIPVFCETGGQSLADFNWWKLIMSKNWNVDGVTSYATLKYKPLLVFGTERSGIPEEFMENGIRVSIPMIGVLRSINVSAAVAMFIWDLKTKMKWY